MDRNIFEIIKLKEKVVKLSTIAFVSAVSMFGVSHATHAMKRSCNNNVVQVVEEQMPDTSTHKVVRETKSGDTLKKVEAQRSGGTSARKVDTEQQRSDSTSACKTVKEQRPREKSEHKMEKLDCYTLGKACYDSGNYEDAFYWIKNAAKDGDVDAQFDLGLCYATARGVQQNDKEAFKCFQKAADKGCIEARFYLGAYYFDGRGVSKDVTKAVECYQEAADKRYAPAQYSLAVLYASGQGVERNSAAAFYWLNESACNGHAQAQFELGKCYHDQGNKSLACYWLDQAARNEHIEAQFALGKCYSDQGNESSACYWFTRAAKNEHVEAQFKLGEYYFVQGKKFESYYWFIRAARNGHVEAQFRLGEYFSMNHMSVAFSWYEKAANNGHVEAKFRLGEYYYDQGNEEAALYWLDEAARKGHVEAQYKLAKYNCDRANISWALYWFGQAANNGHVQAQFELAEYYFEQNYKNIAFYWFGQAANNGHVEAQFRLGEYYFNMDLISVAFVWYKRAAQKGHVEAQFKLGECYARGDLDLNFDIRAAIRCWEPLAKKGYAPAQLKLWFYYFEGGARFKKNIKESAKWSYEYKKQEKKSKSVTNEDSDPLTKATDLFEQLSVIKGTPKINEFVQTYFKKRLDKLREIVDVNIEDTRDVIEAKLQKVDVSILNKLLIEAKDVLQCIEFIFKSAKLDANLDALDRVQVLLNDKFSLPEDGPIVLKPKFLESYVISPWRSCEMTDLENYEILANIYGAKFFENLLYGSKNRMKGENIYDYIFKGRFDSLCKNDSGRTRELLAREMYWFRCMNERYEKLSVKEELSDNEKNEKAAFEKCKNLAETHFMSATGACENELADIMIMWARDIDECEDAMGIGTRVYDQSTFDERFTTAYRQYLAEKVLSNQYIDSFSEENASTGIKLIKKAFNSIYGPEFRNFYRFLVSYLLNVTPTVGRTILKDTEITGPDIIDIVSQAIDWQDICEVAQNMYRGLADENAAKVNDPNVGEDPIKVRLAKDIEKKYPVTFVELCSLVDKTCEGRFEERLNKFLDGCVNSKEECEVDAKRAIEEWIKGKQSFTIAELVDKIEVLDAFYERTGTILELCRFNRSIDEGPSEYYAKVLYPIYMLKTGLIEMNEKKDTREKEAIEICD